MQEKDSPMENQNDDILWSYYSRPNTEHDAGTGEAVLIDGKGDYINLIGLKCIFSTKYLEKKIFSKTGNLLFTFS